NSADPLASVRCATAPERARERTGRAGNAAAPRTRFRHRRPPRSLALRGNRPRVDQRLGGRLHRAMRPFGRLAAVCADPEHAGARGPPRSAPPRRLCLEAMADELKPVYLIAGTDRPKIDRAVQRLRARFAPDAVEMHSASEAAGADIVDASN